MINKTEKQTELEFGSGDICVNPGCYTDDENRNIGILAFSNQAPREIGSEGKIKAGQGCKIGDFPAIMTFTKIESIDVIIEALEDVKASMKLPCGNRKDRMCSTRDYGPNKCKEPCYKCCYGCNHAVDMDCSCVCNKVAEYYHPKKE